MDLKKLVVDSKAMWIDFSGLEGFSVEVANLSRKELTGLRKKCTTTKFNRKSRAAEEVLDEDKFVIEFARATIKGWKGLSLAHLETLILVDTDGQDLSEEVEYSEENAEILVSQSAEFDTWLNEVVFDLDNFRSKPKREMPKKAGDVAKKH
jgi:hypothetical protein|tara:strand:- start:4404 stop:4856 length:453 start_codon:yes stop_codon:yes gene_type:complete